MSKAREEKSNSALEQELGRTIRESAPDVVRKVIEKAKEGSYLHAKFLFDFAGLDLKQSAADDEGAGESLAEYLLRELKPAPGADSSATG